MPEYINETQRIVVEAYIKKGYETLRQKNGFWVCFKGRHKVIINGLGFDVYAGIQ
jgi:hypothetical protein